ncbi:MAG: ribosome maturation factor RimP [Coxiellaceae bacterium]|jgi:ribosome maturation factor RimP|nr:ribosome maturation factor RimP [Coxiellaceae bacterium]
MKIGYSEIEDLVTPIIEKMGFIVWYIEVYQAKRKTLLRIYVDAPDKEKGVDIDDCGSISSQVGALLDVEMPTLGGYVLEISSPGLNRSLYKLEHYQKYIGNNVHITLFKPQNENHDFTGKIQEAFDNTLKLVIRDETMTFGLTNIKKAKLISDF